MDTRVQWLRVGIAFPLLCLLVLAISLPVIAGPPAAGGSGGVDPRSWQATYPSGYGTWHENVFPGIDMRYTGDTRKMECVLSVQSSSDPRDIRMATGSKGATADAGGAVLQTPEGPIEFSSLSMMQEPDGISHAVTGSFIVTGDAIGIRVEQYDPTLPLTVKFQIAFPGTASGGEVK